VIIAVKWLKAIIAVNHQIEAFQKFHDLTVQVDAPKM
jgi:hypothetical protein